MFKKSILSSVIFISLATCSQNAFSRTYEMPDNCELDGNTAYDFSISNLEEQIQFGYDIYNDPSASSGDISAHQGWIEQISELINSFDSVKVSAPKHVLRGQTFRAKGEAFLDPYVNIKFSNSEKGYVGTDKTNLETNAYKNMSFSNTYGIGLVWAHRASGLCSSQQVWVQFSPDITINSASDSSGAISASISYDVDKYSKAAKNPSTNVRVELKATSEIYGSVSTKYIYSSILDNNINLSVFPSAGGGPYLVQATVSDGTYSKSYTYGTIFISGPSSPPCQSCQPL
ncbi:hypothetical protein SAMN05216262_1229 [Colwellia chukchiensis]|uniref:Uncharacterized protein n=1 Tax=Colwellia chukchiensis TaxID=641665 RepID=A0A1H7SZY2_9GAMM|nr:hypothetical protein [Colwellia chukchiensis]SEL78230.1 hypothetical protein SAMN05216262_1229 [Colwellia chukchiensis]